MGAAPVKICLALFKPRLDLILFLITLEINGIFNKILSLLRGILDKIPCWNFVQILGTPRNTVGLIYFKFS